MYLRFASLSVDERKNFMRLLVAVHAWQRHTDESAGENIRRLMARLPDALLLEIQPTMRELGQAVRGDSATRMTMDGDLYSLRPYEIAGFGNWNTAAFFGDTGASGFSISGRDIVGLSAAVSTPRLAAWMGRRDNRAALDAFSAAHEKSGAEWTWMHEEIADDESEIIVADVTLRPFTSREVERGLSSRLPPRPRR